MADFLFHKNAKESSNIEKLASTNKQTKNFAPDIGLTKYI